LIQKYEKSLGLGLDNKVLFTSLALSDAIITICDLQSLQHEI